MEKSEHATHDSQLDDFTAEQPDIEQPDVFTAEQPDIEQALMSSKSRSPPIHVSLRRCRSTKLQPMPSRLLMISPCLQRH